MSTLLDVDVVVLEDLEDVPECDSPACETKAAYACVCRHCRRVILVCALHLAAERAAVEVWCLLGQRVACSACLTVAKSFDDAFEVIPL